MVTYILIALNVLFFLVEMNGGEAFILRWAFVPRRFLADPAGDLPTLFTAMFMHAGWMHLIGNMLYLWIFGDNVEDRFGHGKFLIFYLVCGLAATFAQLAFSAGSAVPNLGASGQVRVMMGRGVVPAPALVVIGIWFALQLFSGIGSVASTVDDGGGVAYMAHVGGFVAGFLLTLALRGKAALTA